MKVELWHDDFDTVIEIKTIPQIGSFIHLNNYNEFTSAAGTFSFVVIRINYWLNSDNLEDMCAVVVRNYGKKNDE